MVYTNNGRRTNEQPWQIHSLPPQYPGFLDDEEYHDIVAVLFMINDRSPDENITVPTPSPTPTFTLVSTSIATQSNADDQSNAPLLISGLSIIFFAAVTFLALQKHKRKDR